MLSAVCAALCIQRTYQHPASHFVFLRAPTGLDGQVLPVPRQKLHPLDTILSSNYLNRGEGLGKNFGAHLRWNCTLNHTCTQFNTSYTRMCFVQQQHFLESEFHLILHVVPQPLGCVSLTSAATQSDPVFRYGRCWAVGCANIPCADLSSQNSCLRSQGCV